MALAAVVIISRPEIAYAAAMSWALFGIIGAIIGALVGWLLWAAGITGAFLTGLYTFRLLFIVFFGEVTPYAREHLHKERFEGPRHRSICRAELAHHPLRVGLLGKGAGA